MKFTFEKWTIIASNAFFWCVVIISMDPIVTFFITIHLVSTFLNVRRIEDEQAQFLRNGTLRLSVVHVDTFRVTTILLYAPTWLFMAYLLPRELSLALIYAGVCSVASIYFAACIPHPPSKSKVRETYEKLLTAINDRLRPPVPAGT